MATDMNKVLLLLASVGLQVTQANANYLPLATNTASTDLELAKRQNCPPNTYHCPTSLGAAFDDICCLVGEECKFDVNNNPACCPAGAVCVGTAPASRPLATANPTASTFVVNSYFPFPYIATSFQNPGACSSAVDACSRNHQACLTELAGAGFSVTIEVPGIGGTTIAPTRSTAEASAVPICASLSTQACFDLQTTDCARGTAKNGIVIGVSPMTTPPLVAATFAALLVALFGI